MAARPMIAGRTRRCAEPRLDDFVEIVSQTTDPADFPLATGVDCGVVTYRASEVAGLEAEARLDLLAEVARALLTGPGIVAITGAVEPAVVEAASAVFWDLIAEQRRSDAVAGDHFAKPGANDRIWNALEKLARRDPAAFARYYANEPIALASEAWLGPGYQMTSQINVVNPGGEAQQPHRDYHLGFMTDEVAARYPGHVHHLSPALTLQGAVAHCDMPVETGPTMYLPHSQKYELGYLAWRRPEFIGYFAGHRVQPELATGDAVFFNPAVFHAAGPNRTADVKRMANLLQVSSMMGRAMETVDRAGMCRALYPVLVERCRGALSDDDVRRVVTAAADGYPFPTDLDRDQPVGGLAPPSQADVVNRALAEGWSVDRLAAALDDHAAVRR